jgi:hypothetical protein
MPILILLDFVGFCWILLDFVNNQTKIIVKRLFLRGCSSRTSPQI